MKLKNKISFILGAWENAFVLGNSIHVQKRHAIIQNMKVEMCDFVQRLCWCTCLIVTTSKYKVLFFFFSMIKHHYSYLTKSLQGRFRLLVSFYRWRNSGKKKKVCETEIQALFFCLLLGCVFFPQTVFSPPQESMAVSYCICVKAKYFSLASSNSVLVFKTKYKA